MFRFCLRWKFTLLLVFTCASGLASLLLFFLSRRDEGVVTTLTKPPHIAPPPTFPPLERHDPSTPWGLCPTGWRRKKANPRALPEHCLPDYRNLTFKEHPEMMRTMIDVFTFGPGDRFVILLGIADLQMAWNVTVRLRRTVRINGTAYVDEAILNCSSVRVQGDHIGRMYDHRGETYICEGLEVVRQEERKNWEWEFTFGSQPWVDGVLEEDQWWDIHFCHFGMPTFDFVAGTMTKDRVWAVDEWLEYQQYIGFQYVIIWDNGSSDDLEEYLATHWAGYVHYVNVHYFPRMLTQVMSIRDMLYRFRCSAKWVMTHDLDEFPMFYPSLPGFVQEMQKEVPLAHSFAVSPLHSCCWMFHHQKTPYFFSHVAVNFDQVPSFRRTKFSHATRIFDGSRMYRTKCLFRPDWTRNGEVHYVQTYAQSGFVQVPISLEDAWFAHTVCFPKPRHFCVVSSDTTGPYVMMVDDPEVTFSTHQREWIISNDTVVFDPLERTAVLARRQRLLVLEARERGDVLTMVQTELQQDDAVLRSLKMDRVTVEEPLADFDYTMTD